MSSDPMAELLALRQQVSQLSAYVAQHQQSAAAQMVAAPVVVSTDKPRLLAPPAYDGRSAGGVDLWLREIRKQFAWYGGSMQGDAERIRFAAAHLTAVALDWWESLEQTAPTTWILFEEQIKARFHPANSADAARAAMDGLQQQPKQLVHEYTAEFRRLLLAVPKMEEGDRVFRYVKGLLPRLAGLVRLQAPKTLADAISLAARVDGLAASSEVPMDSVAQGGSVGITAAAGGVAPMDINNVGASSSGNPSMSSVLNLLQSVITMQAAQSEQLNFIRQSSKGASTGSSSRGQGGGNRSQSISRDVMEDRRRRGACFSCGREGHRRAECPDQ